MVKICERCDCSDEEVVFATGDTVCRACRHILWEEDKAAQGLSAWNLRKDAKIAQQEKLNASARGLNYQRMYQEQGGLCAICVQPEYRVTRAGVVKKLAVDHCHKTGVIRRLLCADCNTGLGLFKDRPELLRRAATYLEEWSG